MNWRVRINFEVEVEYEGSRLKWLARNNRNRESATAMLREELRHAVDEKLDELRRFGVVRWTVLIPASSVEGI